jgi:hypothetical protein
MPVVNYLPDILETAAAERLATREIYTSCGTTCVFD